MILANDEGDPQWYSPAIIAYIAMADRHPHIDDNVLAVGVVDNASQHLP